MSAEEYAKAASMISDRLTEIGVDARHALITPTMPVVESLLSGKFVLMIWVYPESGTAVAACAPVKNSQVYYPNGHLIAQVLTLDKRKTRRKRPSC